MPDNPIYRAAMKDARQVVGNWGDDEGPDPFAESTPYTEGWMAAISRAQSQIEALPVPSLRDTLAAMVQPLEWERADEDDGVPQWISGRYFVRHTVWGYRLLIDGNASGERFGGINGDEAAKAAAQADYTRRILAALGVKE